MTQAIPLMGPRRARSPELYQRATELYAAGASCADIGLQMGFSSGTVRTLLVEAGTEIRPRGRGSDGYRYTADRKWHRRDA